jgi:glycosyltransferase involved in cell wall biosynthesis
VHVCTVPQTLDFLDLQVAYAQARACEVHAVASPGKHLDAFAARTGASVHAVEMSRQITPLRDLWSLGRLIALLRRLRPKVVHGHTPKGGLLAMIAAWLCRVPVRVYHLHGLPMLTASGVKRRLLRWSEMVSCRLAHRVFCVSESLRDVALAERLERTEKLTVLLHGTINGVDAEGAFNSTKLGPSVRAAVRLEHGIPPDALAVGFVGRLVPDKGVAELVAAWHLLRDEFPGLRLLVIGPAESHDPLPQAVQDLLREDRVHWSGEVPMEGMARVYQAMDVLALPTYREGFGTVLIEAAAMELPTVATRIPGCVDAVRDGETGKLVPPRDARALAAALGAYLRDGELRRRHGTAGRVRALRDFRPEALSEALYREYMRLLGDRAADSPSQPSAVVARRNDFRPGMATGTSVGREV